MVKTLFAPAYWVLGRVSFLAAYLLVCILFLLPTAAALFARDVLPAGQLYAVVAALCVLAVYGLIALRAFVSAGIARIIRITDRIANGELLGDSMQSLAGTRDANRLWGSIMKMNTALGAIVAQVRSSADAIAAGAAVIADGNTQLAQRTHEQAASLEETAGGIEQLAASARQNAESCAQANRLAAASREVALEAAQRMQAMAETMRRIDSSARRVGEILGTVEGIAFQTNILALNAAVEAARAGDQGRGFAVVASEVRSLAQRSAAAAKEIQGLIAESIASAEAGRKLVDGVEGTMDKVVSSVGEVTQVLGSIATASAEQSAGVQEITLAIGQVDAVTQQNAALVEKAAGAAESFRREARELVEVVGRFKTDRSADRGRAVALVKAGAEHVRKHGVQKACADFSDRQGAFVQDDLYIVALDLHCNLLAFAPDPTQVGRNDADLCDADGRYFSRTKVEMAKQHGSGWYDFRIRNPRTGRVEPKSMYYERVGDIVLGCGIYDSRAEAATAPAAAAHAPWPQLGNA